jgi:hypothetical protein
MLQALVVVRCCLRQECGHVVTTCQRDAQRLALNISLAGAQENIFYKPEGTYHGIINHTRDGACHANIIRSKNQDTWS